MLMFTLRYRTASTEKPTLPKSEGYILLCEKGTQRKASGRQKL